MLIHLLAGCQGNNGSIIEFVGIFVKDIYGGGNSRVKGDLTAMAKSQKNGTTILLGSLVTREC
ncbi:hypothetical protein ACFLTG_02165 [Chloroflexota bacterium]